jgi:hypothetical protein
MCSELQDKKEQKIKNFKIAATSDLAVLSIYLGRHAS